jgi:hypothetical protein
MGLLTDFCTSEVQKHPEDGTIVPKHFGVIQDNTICMLHVNLIGLVK